MGSCCFLLMVFDGLTVAVISSNFRLHPRLQGEVHPPSAAIFECNLELETTNLELATVPQDPQESSRILNLVDSKFDNSSDLGKACPILGYTEFD